MRYTLGIFLVLAVAINARFGLPNQYDPVVHPQDKTPRTDVHGDPLPHGAVARLGTTRLRHIDDIRSVAFLATTNTLVSTSSNGTVSYWNSDTGKKTKQVLVKGANFHCMAAARDGGMLALSSAGMLHLLDADKGDQLRTIEEVNSTFLAVALSPDNKLMASGCHAGPVVLWDTTTGKLVRKIAADTNAYSLSFSPDGQSLAVGGDWGALSLHDVATGKLVHELKGHKQVIWSIAFSPDGKKIASVGQDGTFRLWDPATGQEISKPLGHKGRITCVAFSPDNKVVATGGQDDGTVRLWDPITGKLLRTLTGCQNAIVSVSFSNDSKTVAACSGHAIHMWNAATGDRVETPVGHENEVRWVAFSPDGKFLATAGADETVRIWDAETTRQIHQFPGYRHSAAAVFTPDKRSVVSGLPNGKICLWDLTTAKEQRQFVGYAPLAVSPNGKWLAANTLQGVSQIELESGKQIREFKNGGAPEAQAISADGKSLAFVNGWGSCWVVDTQTHEVSFHLPGPEKQASALYAVAFHPGAKLLASGGIDGKIHLHNVTTKSLVFQFPGHRELGAPEAWGNEGRRLGEIRSLAFSPDGRTLATCGEHDAVILWEVLTGKQRQALRGHGTNVWCVAFSPDGRRLASAGADGTVLLWELLSPMK